MAKELDPKLGKIVAGNGGLPKLQITAPHATGEIYLHGAHVSSWKPAGHDELLWLSRDGWWEEGKPIRGGVPICFPWFGAKKDTPGAPGHGFARLRKWDLLSVEPEADGVRVTLGLKNDAAGKAWFSGDFELRYRVTFGSKLTMQLEVLNAGASEFAVEEALHTYFTVGDVRQVTVAGLENERFLDKVDGAKEKTQEGPIHIAAETDRVYFTNRRTATIEDPVLHRRILIHKENSADTVVWNPWIAKAKAMPDFGDDEWPGMICVETCNVMKNAITLQPHQQHTMASVIEVTKL